MAQARLDNFTAKLDFNAGADVWANGQVIVARQGAGRRLTLDLDSRLEGLAPGVIQPVFAGQTTLKGDVQFNDDSSIALPGGLHLVSAAARLDFEGERSANGLLDFKVHAGAIPGSTTVGKLDLNASINGPLSSPTIDGAFDAGEIRVEQGSVERVEATFRASPDGPLTEEKTRILFESQASVKGLALADPAFAQAIGRELTLKMRGSASSTGEATFDVLDLSAPNFDAQYSGLLSGSKIHGKANIVARDLSRFALLAGRRAQRRSAHRRRSGRRPTLWRAERDHRRACDETRDELCDARQGHRRNARPDGRRAADAWRRFRLL